jgi:hypothetical protein
LYGRNIRGIKPQKTCPRKLPFKEWDCYLEGQRYCWFWWAGGLRCSPLLSLSPLPCPGPVQPRRALGDGHAFREYNVVYFETFAITLSSVFPKIFTDFPYSLCCMWTGFGGGKLRNAELCVQSNIEGKSNYVLWK